MVIKLTVSCDKCALLICLFVKMQYGDQADEAAHAKEARSEEILSKEFASKTRVESHKSQTHEEVKDGHSTKSESHRDTVRQVAKGNPSAGEGGSVRDHE